MPVAAVAGQLVAGMRVVEVVRQPLDLQDRQEAPRLEDEVEEVQPLLARVRKSTRRMILTTTKVSLELA